MENNLDKGAPAGRLIADNLSFTPSLWWESRDKFSIGIRCWYVTMSFTYQGRATPQTGNLNIRVPVCIYIAFFLFGTLPISLVIDMEKIVPQGNFTTRIQLLVDFGVIFVTL